MAPEKETQVRCMKIIQIATALNREAVGDDGKKFTMNNVEGHPNRIMMAHFQRRHVLMIDAMNAKDVQRLVTFDGLHLGNTISVRFMIVECDRWNAVVELEYTPDPEMVEKFEEWLARDSVDWLVKGKLPEYDAGFGTNTLQ